MDTHSDTFQEFIPTDADRIKYELAKRYHEETEAFDRTVCTGSILNGSIMPASSYEFKVINKYACNLRHELIREAQKEGISPKELHRAIIQYRG